MLLVKTSINKSKIDGIGLFAAEFIPKGTLIWKFFSGFDFIMKKKEVNKLPEVGKSWVLRYGYYNGDEGGYVICVDDARFFNHSGKPNTENTGKIGTIATKDISNGEEITCDYFEFDADAKLKVGKRRRPPSNMSYNSAVL